jgi:hypothetical protein
MRPTFLGSKETQGVAAPGLHLNFLSQCRFEFFLSVGICLAAKHRGANAGRAQVLVAFQLVGARSNWPATCPTTGGQPPPHGDPSLLRSVNITTNSSPLSRATVSLVRTVAVNRWALAAVHRHVAQP